MKNERDKDLWIQKTNHRSEHIDLPKSVLESGASQIPFLSRVLVLGIDLLGKSEDRSAECAS